MSKALDLFRAGLNPGDRLECLENTYWTKDGSAKLPPVLTVEKNGPTVLAGTYQEPNQHGVLFERSFRIDWPLARDIIESSPDQIRYRLHVRNTEYATTWRKLPPAAPAFELRITDIDTRLAEARAQLETMKAGTE